MIVSVVLLAVALSDLPKLPVGECFTTSFTQTRSLPALQQPLTLNGHLRFERNGDLDWLISSPYQYRFYSKGDRFAEVTPDGVERQLDPAQAPWLAGVQRLFGALLAGNGEILQAWFEPGEPERDADDWTLSLKPANLSISQAVTGMTVGYSTYLKFVEIREAGGGKTLIHFESLQACSTEKNQ